MAISDYSTTPASNTSLSGIDITGTTGKVKDGDNGTFYNPDTNKFEQRTVYR